MPKQDRQQKLIEAIKNSPALSVNDLSTLFQVSPMTIRRDLTELEKSKRIVRLHGGAFVSNKESVSPAFQRAEENADAKERIAAAAAALVRSGDSIILDGGSTVGAMGKYLQQQANLTVITPSLYCVQNLRSPNLSVLIPGGVLLQQDSMLIGADCEAYFKNVVADIVFVGASGIRSGRGITIVSPFQYSIKKVMISSAKKVVALVDHTKFQKDGLNLVADFCDIDVLITDLPIEDTHTLQYLEEVGTKVIYTG